MVRRLPVCVFFYSEFVSPPSLFSVTDFFQACERDGGTGTKVLFMLQKMYSVFVWGGGEGESRIS